MKSLYSALLAGVALVAISGCASMRADECLAGDWRAIGFEDGARGYTADHLGQYRKSCAKHGVTPDFIAYRDGRDEGLREFCQPSRGFTHGANGGTYYGVCASDQEPYFLDGYRRGQHLHTLRREVAAVNRQIDTSQHALDDVKQQIRDTEAALISSETAAEERILLLVDLKELAEETGRLEAEIDRLNEERVGHEQELASYQAVLAASGY